MTLKVIGAGLGRTGTLSLKLALEHVGLGPTHHMSEFFANMPDQIPRWASVIAGNPDWDSVFEGYASCVDYPACMYWRELMDHYPEAKVILTVRNPESWFTSVSETIFSPRMHAMTLNTPAKDLFNAVVYRDFGDRIGDRDFMIDYFNRWNDAVTAAVPADRLLVFEAKQGWEPLCSFLGVPVPNVPYPRVNSREEMLDANERQGVHQEAPIDPEQMRVMMKARLAAMREAAFGASTSV